MGNRLAPPAEAGGCKVSRISSQAAPNLSDFKRELQFRLWPIVRFGLWISQTRMGNCGPLKVISPREEEAESNLIPSAIVNVYFPFKLSHQVDKSQRTILALR